MVRTILKIKFNHAATQSLESAISHIRSESVKNAEKVKLDMLLKIEDIASYPTKYPLDKYKNNNDGTYRAFELHHYRISYRVLEAEVRIIRLRHTSMEPLNY